MIPQANEIYKHFKGNLYRIITVAKDSETGKDVVVYQALYGDYTVYVRTLDHFMEVLDFEKYPEAKQKYRFQFVREMVEPVYGNENAKKDFKVSVEAEAGGSDFVKEREAVLEKEEKQPEPVVEEKIQQKSEEEYVYLDPMLEAYLDADSYRERLNILHGLRHRVTGHMLLTMSVVIDFELPEGTLEQKYDALHDCLMTRERYECNRMG